jgi:hypothetical protein
MSGRSCGTNFLGEGGLRRTDIRFTTVVDLEFCKGLEVVIGLSSLLPVVLSDVDGFGGTSFRSQSSRFTRFRFFALGGSLRSLAAASTSPLHCTSALSTISMSGTGSVNRLNTRARSVSLSLSDICPDLSSITVLCTTRSLRPPRPRASMRGMS